MRGDRFFAQPALKSRSILLCTAIGVEASRSLQASRWHGGVGLSATLGTLQCERVWGDKSSRERCESCGTIRAHFLHQLGEGKSGR
jgi:hypothetical protein